MRARLKLAALLALCMGSAAAQAPGALSVIGHACKGDRLVSIVLLVPPTETGYRVAIAIEPSVCGEST